MTLLVAGADRVDAGKTTFTTGLLAYLARAGADPVGFKPRAGNDYWFDHDDYRTATARSRLYGKDAKRLAAASSGTPAPEAINPLHRLWRPTPGRTGLLGESERTFLCDRVTRDGRTEYVVNGQAEADGVIPDGVHDSLPLTDATRVTTIEEFNQVMADRYMPAFEALGEQIRRTDDAVVESYGDIALPLRDLDVEAVAVVAPGQVQTYDGERYVRAREVASGSPKEGQLEERVPRIIDMLEPTATRSLPALGGDARDDPDAVADAYADAYEALLDAV